MDLDKKGQARFLDNYRDHYFETSLGLMRIGVCVNCKADLVTGKNTDKVAKGIMDKHVNYWKRGKNAPQGFEKIILLDTNSSEEKVLRRRNKAELEQMIMRDEGMKSELKKEKKQESKKISKK